MRRKMKLDMGFTAFVAMAGLAVFAGRATAEQAITRDLTIEQKAVADFAPPESDLKVTAWLDRNDGSYKIGDVARLYVKTNQDSYITIVDVGTSGQVHVLFPNKHDTDNHLLAYQVLQIPSPEAPYRIRVGGPPGHELIKVIATTRPDQLIQSDLLSEAGPFSQYRGTPERLTRDLGIELTERPAAGPAPLTGTVNKVISILAATGALERPQTTASAEPTAAHGGVSPEELFRLGQTSFYGDTGLPNYREALRLFGLAAEGGHVGAMYFSGRIYEEGLDVDQDPSLALKWYRKAAELGSTPAMVRLALLYAKKNGPRHDLRETVRWLKKAASQGDGTAMVNLAKMYDSGIGVEQKTHEAARYLLDALKAGAWVVIDQAPKCSEETRRELQQQLQIVGSYHGAIDGQIGADTRAAMIEFARTI